MTFPHDPNQPQPSGQAPYGQAHYGQPQAPYAAQPQHGQSYPQQPYGQPQPPAKKKRKWPWVVGGVVLVLIVAGMVGRGDEEKSTTTAQSTTSSATAPVAAGNAPSAAVVAPIESASPAPAPEQSAPGIGQEVRDGKFGFVVTGVETGVATLGDNPYLQKDALGQFVLVSVTVTNVSDRAQSYFGSNQKLIDAQGREFENDAMAAINLEAETAIGGDINPGLSQNVTIVFDVPLDAVPATLEVHDSMFSGGAEISLR
jgi:hypothetical protein